MEARMTVKPRSKPQIEIPQGWTIVEGAGTGQSIPDEFDLEWVKVHQGSESWITGHELVKRGKALDRPLPNLDHAQRLLDGQEHIPAEIRGQVVLVLTNIVLRDPNGNLDHVLYFCWHDRNHWHDRNQEWYPRFGCLGRNFLDDARVVCLGK